MEILKDTFEQRLPLVADAINTCDFIAIDAEFTGLHRHQGQHRFHTIQKRFEVFVNAVSNFAIIQFGICTFHWSSTANRYFAKPFNFYVFPRGTRGRKEINRCFGVQSGAFDFLTTCGFDFNKWVYHGVSYLTEAEEEDFEKESQEKLNNTMADIPIDHQETEFMENVRKSIDKWIASNPNRKKDSLEIAASNGYRRRLVYQEVRNLYPELIAFGKRSCICVCWVDKKREEKRQTEKKMQFEQEKQEAIGFRKVIDLMSSSGKTIVGHNVFLDLCHMVNQFIAPLPPNVVDFKRMVHSRFPCVVDTKYLGSQAPDLAHLHSTSLENIYFETRLPPFDGPRIELHWDFPLYNESKAHEAAYDAYITGFVFLRMSTYIYSKTLRNPTPNPEDVEDDLEEEPAPEVVYKWDPVPEDKAAPEIDITNVTWDKKFDNHQSVDMVWGGNTSNEADEMPMEQPMEQPMEKLPVDNGSNTTDLEDMINEAHNRLKAGNTTNDCSSRKTASTTDNKDVSEATMGDDATVDVPDVIEEDPNAINILTYYGIDGLLSQYANKLTLIKSVAPYISLVEPEVLSDQSCYFHVFPKDKGIDKASLTSVLKPFGKFFLEWNDNWSVFVAFDKLASDQATVRSELATVLHEAGLEVETMYDYIDNEGANAIHSSLAQSFNNLDI